MKNKMVYLPLKGRIGNQLFQFAFAYVVSNQYDKPATIIIDESEVIEAGWENSLKCYELENVLYVQSDYARKALADFWIQRMIMRIYKRTIVCDNPITQKKREDRFQGILNKFGVVAVEKGYSDISVNTFLNSFLYGYFQSERYFASLKEEIVRLVDLSAELNECGYPNLDLIRSRNSVCISIKIEHNIGSSKYDVCGIDYYQKAIQYIVENVENPLFFLCSDNVEEARKLFFSDFDGEVVCQSPDYSTALSLCVMSQCKHFVINNTSYGWWAQFLSESTKKIVVVPSRWVNTNDPISIYDMQENWHLIEV